MASREEIMNSLRNANDASENMKLSPEERQAAAAAATRFATMLSSMDSPQATQLQTGAEKATLREDLTGGAQRFLSAAAFNFGDEAMGGIANLYGNMYSMLANTPLGQDLGLTGRSEITGEDINKDITLQSATQSVRDEMEAFKERNPNAALATDIGGALTGGLSVGLKVLPRAPTSLKGIAAVAGAEGLLSGLGAGEGLEDRLQRGATEGTLSAIMGPLAKVGLDQIAQRAKIPFRGESMREEAERLREGFTPTMDIEGVERAAKEFYKVADDSGFRLKPEYYNTYKEQMTGWMDQYNITGKRFPMLGKAISELKKMDSPNYQQLQGIKDMLVNAMKSPNKPRQQELAFEMNRSVDNLIDRMTTADVAEGSAAGVAEALQKGRNLWRRKSQGELLDSMMQKARYTDAVEDMDNLDKALRRAVKPALINERQRLAFDPDTLEGLDRIIYGNRAARIARAGGRIAPSESTARGFFPSIGSAGLGVAMTGSPAGSVAGIIPGLVGGISRKLANRMTAQEFERLQKAVLNKGQMEVQEVLDELMKKYDLGRAAASVGGTSAAGQVVSTPEAP